MKTYYQKNRILSWVFIWVMITQLSLLSCKKNQSDSDTAKDTNTYTGDAEYVEFAIEDLVTMKFKLIPAGSFLMGSPDKERQKIDGPRHQVTITEPYYIGVYEVTQHQWNKVMRRLTWNTHSHFAARPDNPIEDVSWSLVQEFLEKINSRGEGVFRLPTEAEWEYACRAGTTTRCYWGDDPEETVVDKYAWRSGSDDLDGSTHPVGQKPSNPWGLYDMCGNVVELCQDRYAPFTPGHQVDPLIQEGKQVVGRGGDWFHASGVDSETRRTYNPDGGLSFLGFRVVRNVD